MNPGEMTVCYIVTAHLRSRDMPLDYVFQDHEQAHRVFDAITPSGHKRDGDAAIFRFAHGLGIATIDLREIIAVSIEESEMKK